LWAISALAVACLTGCQPESLPPPTKDEKLVVAVRPGPTSWFPGPDGQPSGFDHDLLQRFADKHKLKLEIVEVGSAAALLAKVAAGEVHLGAGGLYRPPAGVARDATANDGSRVLWTIGFHVVDPVLIYTTDGFKPSNWRDLAGASVGYVEGTGI
jgi:membrane-bound lytic murein transglycosylase MltF